MKHVILAMYSKLREEPAEVEHGVRHSFNSTVVVIEQVTLLDSSNN